MSTPKKLKQQTIFGGSLESPEAIEEDLDKLDDKRDTTGLRKPSAYVEVFESASHLHNVHWTGHGSQRH